jgi:hypothetical protein
MIYILVFIILVIFYIILSIKTKIIESISSNEKLIVISPNGEIVSNSANSCDKQNNKQYTNCISIFVNDTIKIINTSTTMDYVYKVIYKGYLGNHDNLNMIQKWINTNTDNNTITVKANSNKTIKMNVFGYFTFMLKNSMNSGKGKDFTIKV